MNLPNASIPKSATNGPIASITLIGFIVAFVIIRLDQPFGIDLSSSALFIVLVTSSFIFTFDLAWVKVFNRPSTELDFTIHQNSWPRTIVKFIGLLGGLGFIGFLYWLFPEYHSNAFFRPYFAMLGTLIPIALLLAIPYIYWIDSHMTKPHDGYYHMGLAVLGKWSSLNRSLLGQHLLGWLVKGFFLPLMFAYMCSDLGKMMHFSFNTLTSFQSWFAFLYDFIFFIDVSVVSMGYLMSFRLTDTHLRSTEPTMLGWTVALVCYEPFWGLIGKQYFAYDTGNTWGAWLWNTPVLYGIWGTFILILIGIYVWATVAFGARFSNLTHRGIITNGPYILSKHPAYIAKNLSWWMISIPFLITDSGLEALRHSLMLIGVNIIYILRAKTEEWHLSRDPDYVTYAQWIEIHGIFRWIRFLPLLRFLAYKAPKQKAS